MARHLPDHPWGRHRLASASAARRQDQREESRTAFRFAVEERPLAELPHVEEIDRLVSEVAPPPTSVVSVDQSRQMVNVGTVNIHVGDVHSHVHVEQNVTVVKQAVTTEVQVAVEQSSQAESVPEDERCERLRLEHEARVSQWNRLFNRPRPVPARGRR